MGISQPTLSYAVKKLEEKAATSA
ncbi:hypothetical protein [Lactobacillus delbrueckii]